MLVKALAKLEPKLLGMQRLGVGSGPKQRPQLLAALQDVGGHSEFFNEQKIGCGIGRNYSGRWLHTQIRDLKTQAAHAAHQVQAARSQPNARGAVGQLCGAKLEVERSVSGQDSFLFPGEAVAGLGVERFSRRSVLDLGFLLLAHCAGGGKIRLGDPSRTWA